MDGAGRNYVHGYDRLEHERLQDQAGTLVDLLHSDTFYGPGRRVLEAGCGVGAQTVTLARRSPEAHFTPVDISHTSVAAAERATEGFSNVVFRQADIFAPPFAHAAFGDVFVCFVLEHLSQPVEALTTLATLLRPGGTMTVVEGDHGSADFHPDSAAARAAIACQVELQRRAGGDALVGRRLYPLMVAADLADVHVSPRIVYVDASRPALVDGFTRKTFTAMIEGVRGSAIAAGLADPAAFDTGLRDLHRTTEPDGTFCYAFFKAVGRKRSPSADQAEMRRGRSNGVRHPARPGFAARRPHAGRCRGPGDRGGDRGGARRPAPEAEPAPAACFSGLPRQHREV